MTFWLYALVIACEQVAPHGDPLQPVPVVSKPSLDAAASEEPENTEASEEEVFQISSEELLEAAGQSPTEGAPVEDAGAQQEVPADAITENKASSENAGSAGSAPESVAAPSPTSTTPAATGWGDVIGKKWPVRLVTTIPNATPPRAILGLPDGREVVVNPGSMVPDMGLVVVAIAPNSAELARIAPAGDHATIETMTLRAQY